MPGPKAPEHARREQILAAAYRVALRTGVDGVTVRAVAAEAGLSHGTVLFHFERRDQLVAALLDRVLATTAMLRLAHDPALGPTSDHAPLAVARQLEQVADAPSDIRLFFEYWALGVRQPAIRAKIGAALERYRDALRDLAAEARRDEPQPSAGVTADGIAAVAVSLLSGGAIQALADPSTFDVAAYRATVQHVIARLMKPPEPPPGR